MTKSHMKRPISPKVRPYKKTDLQNKTQPTQEVFMGGNIKTTDYKRELMGSEAFQSGGAWFCIKSWGQLAAF